MLKTLEEGRGSRERERGRRPEEKLLPWLMLLQLLTFMGRKTIDNKYSTHTHVKTLSRDSNKIINALAPRVQNSLILPIIMSLLQICSEFKKLIYYNW